MQPIIYICKEQLTTLLCFWIDGEKDRMFHEYAHSFQILSEIVITL